MSTETTLLKGEGTTRMEKRIRRECDECEELAVWRVAYLLPNARTNPASSGYRRDDISQCSDAERFACEKHLQKVKHDTPDGMSWCGSFGLLGYPHFLLYWVKVPAEDTEIKELRAERDRQRKDNERLRDAIESRDDDRIAIAVAAETERCRRLAYARAAWDGHDAFTAYAISESIRITAEAPGGDE